MALQHHCDSAAMALQRHCDSAAMALQRRCDGAAMALQRHCNSAAMALLWCCDVVLRAIRILRVCVGRARAVVPSLVMFEFHPICACASHNSLHVCMGLRQPWLGIDFELK